MKCIICKENKDVLTREHIFPDAIGGTLITNNVCKSCNDKLGHSVDYHLVNHLLIQFDRMLLKIRGKSGIIPNPLGKGVLASDQQQRVDYRFNKEGEPQELYLFPRVEKISKDDGTETLRISVDQKDEAKLPLLVNKVLKRNGASEMTMEQISEQILKAIEPYPKVLINTQFDILQYKRAILKIAYELAFYWLGDNYFEDPASEMIRKCILDDNLPSDFSLKYPIKGTIDLINKRAMFNFQNENPKNHLAFMNIDGEKINCYIKIFNTFEAFINISNDANVYPTFKGNFISINPVTGVTKESSYSKAISNLRWD